MTSPHDLPKSEALPRALVIRRRTIFEVGRTKAKRYANKYIALNLLPRHLVRQTSPEITSQVAFLTPKRLGPATVRNRLRRRMREIYRRYVGSSTQAAPPYQIWIARPPAVELNFEQLKIQMLDLHARLNRAS